MGAEDSKRIVAEFGRIAFGEGKPREAADQYLAEDYIQHNPQVPSGREAFVSAIGGLFSQFPDASFDVKRIIAEDDLVVLHSLVKFTPDERGHAVADIFRVEDGKVAEHWDVLQDVPETTVSGNPLV
jgi:predicted SnoaL-like aldol condensation-catalyzing enzyme